MGVDREHGQIVKLGNNSDKLEINWIYGSILQIATVLHVQHSKRQEWNEDIRIHNNIDKGIFPVRPEESQSPNI